MLIIKDDVIYVNRGDDFKLDVELKNEDEEEYSLEEGDILTFSVRELPNRDSEVLLTATNVYMQPRIVVSHSQTESIPAGVYSCDIQLTRASGEIITVYPILKDNQHGKDSRSWKNFVVDGEVTT